MVVTVVVVAVSAADVVVAVAFYNNNSNNNINKSDDNNKDNDNNNDDSNSNNHNNTTTDDNATDRHDQSQTNRIQAKNVRRRRPDKFSNGPHERPSVLAQPPPLQKAPRNQDIVQHFVVIFVFS